MSLLVELRRRNVFRVAAAYLVVGWLLTEVLTAILPAAGAPEWTSKAIVLTFALGFLPAIVLAWFYELTPDGIKRDHEVERDPEGPADHRLEYTTIAAVILGVVILGFLAAKPTGDATIDPVQAISSASVAVLPFVNMSNDADNEYFSDGLTETLLHMLAQMPDLKVAARTSSFAFKGQNSSVREIATALGVAHILEGSVQRSGDRVRITAQLIRAEDGFHVWSENYDRTLDDIFGIQDEIAGKVGGALSVSLLGVPAIETIEGVGTDNTDAYDLYLQARKEIATYSFGGLTAAEQLLKGALTIDPNFVDAKTELTNVYLHQVETGLMAPEDAQIQIFAITDQVLADEPDNVLARANRLFAEQLLLQQGTDANELLSTVEQFESLIEEDPDEYQTRILITRALQGLQQQERALDVQLAGLERDPFNPRIHYELGSLYSSMKRFDEARAALKESLRIEPRQPNVHAILAGLSLQAGDGLDYLQNFLKAMETDPQDFEMPGIIAQFLYELELIEEADDFRNRVLALAPASEMAYALELLRAIQVGDEEAAIRSARRAIQDDVAGRRNAFVSAVVYLLDVAVKNDRVNEELAWLEEQAPGIMELSTVELPFKYRAAQYVAFDALYTVLPTSEMVRRLEVLKELADSFGVDPTENDAVWFNVLAWTNQREQAIDLALSDILDKPVVTSLGWERLIARAPYAPLAEDSRVQARLAAWASEEDALRERVRNYLADLRASR